MSLGYFEDRESREKWIGKVEIVHIDPRTHLLDEDGIEGRAWHEKLASDIYDFYGVEVPRLELSKQQCLFDIETYGFRTLPTATHLILTSAKFDIF